MSIQDEINKRVKEEITNDPYHLGYDKMTDEQIKDTLNNFFAIVTSSETIMPPPINIILAGLAEAPNALVEVKDVTDAKDFPLG